MAYQSHTWETGEPITAPLMNRIEEGVYQNSLKSETAYDHANNLHAAIAGEGGALPDTPIVTTLSVLNQAITNISGSANQITALQTRIGDVESEIIAARGTNKTTGEANRFLETRLNLIDSTTDDLYRVIDDVNTTATYAKEAVDNAKRSKATLLEKIMEIDDLNSSQSGLILEIQTAIDRANAVYSKDTLRETITKIRDDIASNAGRIGAAEDNINTNQTNINALQTRIGYGSEEARSIKTIINELNNDLRTYANTQRDTAKSYADDLVAPINTEIGNAHRDTNDTLDARFDDIEAILSHTAEGNDPGGIDERLTAAEDDIESLDGRLDTAEADIDALETEMAGSHRQGVENDTLGAHLGAIDQSIADLLNRSSTEVKSWEWFNTDPQPTGNANIDYIIGPNEDGKYFYYKYIVDEGETPWKLISGGGGGSGTSSALVFNSNAEFENATLNTKDENTDYYVKDSNGYYVHYRFVKSGSGNAATYTKIEIKQDAYSTSQTYARTEVYNKNETDSAIATAIGAMDKDEYTMSYGKQMYYGPEGEAGADAGATPVETDDVLSLFRRESGAAEAVSVSQVIITGGGGGGGQTGYPVTFGRVTQTPVVVTGTDSVIIQFTYTCVDDESQPVSGTFNVKKGNTTIISGRALAQGTNTIDISEYCTTGTQRFSITLSTDGGVAVPAKYWDVQVVDVRLESNFNDRTIYSTTDYVSFTYTPYGANVSKTVHFKLDGVDLDPVVTTSSGSLMSLSLPPQDHGAHLLEVYITANVNGKAIETPHLYKDIIWAQSGNRTPIIGCIYRYDYYGPLTIKQYNSFSIPYFVYDPRSSTPQMVLAENGTTVNTLKVSQNYNTWAYKSSIVTVQYTEVASPLAENLPQLYEKINNQYRLTTDTTVNNEKTYYQRSSNPNTLTIACGTTTVELKVDIEGLGYEITPVTANLAFDFNPTGYSNNDVAHRLWNYTSGINNTVALTVSNNFDWDNGGYRLDSDGNAYFCVKSGTRAWIDYQLFGRNPTTTGAEFKVIFKSTNVRNITASFLRCLAPAYIEKEEPIDSDLDVLYEYANGEYVLTEDEHVDSTKTYYLDNSNDATGLEMRTHQAYLTVTAGGQLEVPYSEDDVIEFEYNINHIDTENSSATSYIMSYEDGVGARPLIYNNDAVLYQTTPSVIEIGSDDCDVWIYRMKAYTSELSDSDVLKNFCADARDSEEMVNRYQRNLIYDENNQLTPESVSAACPDLRVICIEAPYFTNDKADYVKNTTVTCMYANGRPRDNWVWRNGFHVGQGTSSNRYGAAGRNLDIIFGFDGVNTVVKKIKANTVQGYVSEIEFADGTTLTGADAKINLTDTSVENSWFNIKVNIASSENANNALLQKRFNDYLPYTVPSKRRDPRSKNSMEFYNCVIFIKETDDTIDDNGIYTSHREFPRDTDWHFYGIGNIGDSKKTDNTRVADPLDMQEFCIEVSDNNLPNSMFQTGVYELDDHSITYDPTGMSDAEKMERMVYPITEEQWNNENNLARKAISLEGYVSGQKLNEDTGLMEDVITNWDSSFEFRYDMSTKDGVSFPGMEAQQEASKLVWNDMYKWVITASDEDFRTHLSDWFIQESPLYWYLFTERYIMIDSRAKNTFYHYGKVYISDDDYNGTTVATLEAAYEAAEEEDKPAIAKQLERAQRIYTNRNIYTHDNAAAQIHDGYRFDLWDYDNDTALGIDNSGLMKIPYGKEDIDKDANNAYIFNAAENIFWRRIRKCMGSQLTTLYTNTDLTNCWSANNLITEFDRYQNQFPEELWRLDIERKYIRPYKTGAWVPKDKVYVTDDTFLRGMANGRKKYQRRQFERDQEIYVATKYLQSTIFADSIELRLATADPDSVRVVPVNDTIKITPYSDMYIRVMFGNTDVVSRRALAGVEYDIAPPFEITSRNTLQVTIYAASRIQAFSDLSAFYIRDNNFSRATRLKTLVLGNATPGYKNPAIETVGIGMNTLLETLDLRNLPNLTGALNLTNCENLANLYAQNTQITSVAFATGGKIQNAYLPATLNGLTCRNLTMLNNLNIAGYRSLTQFTCVNSNIINPLAIVQAAINTLQNITITELRWNLDSTTILNQIYRKSTSLLTGIATIADGATVRREELNHYNDKWGEDFQVIYDVNAFIEQYRFRFVMYDDNTNTITKDLYECYREVNELLEDPVSTGDLEIPTKPSTYAEDYTFGLQPGGTYTKNSGWRSLTGDAFQTIQVNNNTGNLTFKAIFYATPHKYTVTWYLDSMGLNEFCHDNNVAYNSEAIAPLGVPASTFDNSDNSAKVFVGWDKSTATITENTNVFAVWEEGTLPSTSAIETNGLNGLSVAQIYALGETTPANRINILGSDYIKDYIDITLGEDYNFNNVTSQTLINSNYVLDGSIDNIRFYDGQQHVGSTYPLIKPLSNTDGFTLAIDFKFTQAIANEVLVSCFSTAGGDHAKGFKLMLTPVDTENNLQPCICWGENSTKQQVGYYDYTNNQHYRNIVVIRRPANSSNLYIYYSNTTALQDDAVQVATLSADTTILDMPLMLGAYSIKNGSSYILPAEGVDDFAVPGRGIIYWSKIWQSDLGDSACKQLATWPHETVRFEMQGYNDLTGGISTYKVYENKTNASSTADTTVGLTFNSMQIIGDRAYSNVQPNLSTSGTNTSTTGWYESYIRNFCNTRVYKAFPQKWRSIIVSTPIRSYGKYYDGSSYQPNTSQQQADTGDYITIPTYYEVNGNSSSGSPFTAEGILHRIPWLLSNAGRTFSTYNESGLDSSNVQSTEYNRIKFKELYIPAGAKIYKNAVNNNPANQAGSTVQSGDLWIPSNNANYAYIYVSAEDLATNSYPLQTGNYSCAQGGWVCSEAYWTRSLVPYTNYVNYYVVTHNGIADQGYYQGIWSGSVGGRNDFGLNIQFSV